MLPGVRGTLACLLAVIGLGLLAAPASAGARLGGRLDGRLDVAPIIAALDRGDRVVRAPGTVAHFDEARVRDELGPKTRLVVLPYVDYDRYRTGGEDSTENDYHEVVSRPIQTWALDRELPLLVATGLDVTMVSGGSAMDHRLPADLDELRATTSTGVITERLIVLARLSRGLPPSVAEDVDITYPAPVPADPDRAAEVVDALRDRRLYNAPGRADPVEDWVVEIAKEESGLDLRIAAFPGLEPGQPVVDHLTPLAKAYPDDVVMVLHGDWFDIAAPDQAKALAARAYAYSDADLSLLATGRPSTGLLRDTTKRLDLLLTETAWGYPQPPPQPRALPFDVQRTVATLAPWVLVGSALVLGGAAFYRQRTRLAAAAAVEERALRAESAAAMAAVGDLGATVLAAEEDGRGADPAAAERHATARLLYDQAHTAAAMVEVRRIAEEGLDLLAPPEPKPRARAKKSARAAAAKYAARVAARAVRSARRKGKRR
ncbi:hypothetical protein BLA60_16110 [Actinophytocola xinjiangensis]|uniref:Uncharacterized protein n=1 Tax=Actinophytocola xinjiangensis TaxID=485602 RepID=A0A7Z1AZ82_9PSEU|nr:hypothetical protein BLA60_16110 [Actinophytocola xinjiangensis]